MSNKDDHLIYESYQGTTPDAPVDELLYETIDQLIAVLEGHGISIKPKFNTSELYKLISKMKSKAHGSDKPKESEHDESDDEEDKKRRMLRAISMAGDADYNMPFEETNHEDDRAALAPGEKRQKDGSVVDKDGKVVYKPKPKVAKEGSKGTQSDREKADVNDDDKIEPWEKKRANAIRKNQGKPHLCAKTVNHESYGPGHTVHARHAHPDVNGNIAWYVCEFKHGTEVINTEDLQIVTIVEHTH